MYWANSKCKIDWNILKGLFGELIWTEKYVWKNINRDPMLNQDNLEPEELEKLIYFKEEEKREQMEKFTLGLTTNTDFLSKIEFSSPTEYYSYYLGINCMDIDKTIIKKWFKIILEVLNGVLDIIWINVLVGRGDIILSWHH